MLIDELTVQRPAIPVWLAERSIALGDKLLSQGARSGRDLSEYPLEEMWSGPKGASQFSSFAENILQRRMATQDIIPSHSFSQCLRETLDPGENRAEMKMGIEKFREDVKRDAGSVRYSTWLKDAEHHTRELTVDGLMDLYVTRILISRDEGKRQLTLDLPLPSEELSDRDSSQVRAAAEIFIHEELGVPYYFGLERLCVMATSNIDELLSLAAALYVGIQNKQVLRRPLHLSPAEQERLLKQVLNFGNEYTDIILDVSSLPRVGYLAILTGLLDTLVPDKDSQSVDDHPLKANNVNLQVLVAEDPKLDGNILPEDPSNDLVVVPGYSGIMHAESVKEWPMVWFPILGENRVSQFQKIMTLAQIPSSAEICPVLPHPSRNPRRADDLLVEYTEPLFKSRRTPTTNILHVHESQPFEGYRQLLGAMQRYQHSLQILGGCRLLVTPLSSKLITLGAGLACFEMKTAYLDARYGVTIPYAEPKRYVATRPEIAALLLTGEAYA